ncbi:MAG: hypothetical protein I3273_04950 [Candidatus Moeniiplasma glomeromycotorum]|nr:hypothetical protein [Candidatus Moeniiplasma glomeromycotorum]MCE8167890.1 hypothetical protein [Candidatus Moeniiplasma glomeromycotorum]MCE8169440.1 hypothetical protein [Candidatus Moeniiplasma glomeromycotorum]
MSENKKCLKCQNITKENNFCNDKCCNDWANENFETFRKFSTDGTNDSGIRCKKCQQKIMEYKKSISGQELQEQIKHWENCQGEERKQKDKNDKNREREREREREIKFVPLANNPLIIAKIEKKRNKNYETKHFVANILIKVD